MQSTSTARRTMKLGHSPDPDDAFMFHPLLSGKVDCPGIRFEQVLDGIESLNRAAIRGELEVTAASVHATALLGEAYKVLDCGASVGDGYGPMIVASEPLDLKRLGEHEVLVPGILTTAYLAARLAAGPFKFKVTPFDQIIPEIVRGKARVGLIIHEGQLTYASRGLHLVIDLGEWWKRTTGLPLPLGVNVVRADLGNPTIQSIADALRRSIDWALEHRAESIKHAAAFGRGIDEATTDKFVGMYVNDWTRSLGATGREAIRRLIDEGRKQGLIPEGTGPVFA